MSLEAIVWGWKQDVGNPIRKLILIHMCDTANDLHGYLCWHKISTISDVCEVSRSSVKNHLKALCDSGFLTLTEHGGPRTGTNKYRVNCVGQKVGQEITHYPKGGSGDNRRQSADNPLEGQEITHSGSGDNPINDKGTKPRTKKETLWLPDWLPKEKWNDYIGVRKSMKKHPMEKASLALTLKAIKTTIDSGYSADDILDQMIANGWRSVAPKFMEGKAQKNIKPETKKQVESSQNAPKNFDQESYEAEADRRLSELMALSGVNKP